MTDAARDETPAPEETDVDGPGYAVDAPSGDDWADASDAEHEDAVESIAGPAEEHDLPFEDAGPNEARLSGAEPDGSAGDPNFAPRAAAPWESETDAVSSGADAIPAGGAHDGYEDYEDGDPAHPFGTNAPETDPAPATASVSDASASSDWRLAPFATPQAAPEDATEDATEDASASVGFDRDASDDAPPETIFGAPDGAAGPALAPAAPDSTATLFGDSDLSPGAPVNIFGDPDASDGAGDLEPRDGPEDPEDATGPAGEPEEATIIGRPVRATVLPPEDTDDAPDPAGEPEEINIFGGPARAAVLPSEEADDADDAPEPARETEETTIFGASARATVLPPEDPDDAPGPAEEPEEINIFGGPAPEPAAEQPQARDELRRRLFGGPSAAAPGPRWIEDPNEPAPLARPTSDRLGSVMSRYRGETGQGDEPADDADDGPVTAVWHPAEGPAIEPGTLAERANAVTVPDLLTVAAAWLTLVDRRSTFGRREVMEVFDQMPGDHPRTLEARIKGYGKLVRNGSLVLVDDGRFALSQEERDRFRPLIG